MASPVLLQVVDPIAVDVADEFGRRRTSEILTADVALDLAASQHYFAKSPKTQGSYAILEGVVAMQEMRKCS